MGGRGSASAAGKAGASGYGKMRPDMKEMFDESYNFMDADFKSNYTLEQAYVIALEKYNSDYAGNSQMPNDQKARNGMAAIYREFQKSKSEKKSAELKNLQNQYLESIKGKKGAKDEAWGIRVYGSTMGFKSWLRNHGK